MRIVKTMSIRTLIIVCINFLFVGICEAQDSDLKTSSHNDTSQIHWELPGSFDKALERARTSNRILMVKGVSFGIDSIGATCANKGTW